MKKIFLVTLFLSIAFIKSECHALIVGDEITVEDASSAVPVSKLQLGLGAEFVRDKELKPDTGDKKISFEGDRLLGKLTFSPFENIDIYAKIGVGEDTLDDSNKNIEIKSDVGVAYGGGLKANLKRWDELNTFLGMDIQFLRFTSGIDKVNISGANYSSPSGDFTVSQWQIAAYIAKEFSSQLVAYAGAEYADSRVEYDYDTGDRSGNNEGKNDDILGLLTGINLSIVDEAAVFVEGHLIDEASVSLGVNIRF